MNFKSLINNIVLINATIGMVGLSHALASTSSKSGKSKLKIEDIKKDPSRDIDSEITNARMRATSGSKSKISVSTRINYQGGSVKNAFGVNRPDIYGNPEEEASSGIQGRVSLRYRFNPEYSLTAGTGIYVRTPLQGDVDTKNGQSNLDNPEIEFSKVFKNGDFQNISSIGSQFRTNRASRNINLFAILSASHNMLTNFNGSPLSVGGIAALDYYTYSDSANAIDGRPDYGLALYPYLEYSFNDTYSFRTVFGYFSFEHTRQSRKDKSPLNMTKAESYQSVGLAVSITRDIYVYPNIQFLPEKLDAENTNVALSTTINIF